MIYDILSVIFRFPCEKDQIYIENYLLQVKNLVLNPHIRCERINESSSFSVFITWIKGQLLITYCTKVYKSSRFTGLLKKDFP